MAVFFLFLIAPFSHSSSLELPQLHRENHLEVEAGFYLAKENSNETQNTLKELERIFSKITGKETSLLYFISSVYTDDVFVDLVRIQPDGSAVVGLVFSGAGVVTNFKIPQSRVYVRHNKTKDVLYRITLFSKEYNDGLDCSAGALENLVLEFSVKENKITSFQQFLYADYLVTTDSCHIDYKRKVKIDYSSWSTGR